MATRVAFSVFGNVKTLNGHPAKLVVVEAVGPNVSINVNTNAQTHQHSKHQHNTTNAQYKQELTNQLSTATKHHFKQFTELTLS